MVTLYLAFAFTIVAGACVGSFLNVVIYRVPEGRSIVYPGSSCPRCGHKLAWHDNVPVLGWLWLKGKCRYCAAPIAAQYPIVEAVTALLFGLWFAVCYLTPLRPGFSAPPGDETGMIFAISLVLVGSLIASTVIDARLYIIPLSITWLVTGVGVIGLTLAVWLFPRSVVLVDLPAIGQMTRGERIAAVDERLRSAAEARAAVFEYDPGPVTLSAAPWVSAPLAGAGFGGAIGLAIAIGLLRAGVLKVSFADESDEPPEEQPLESHEQNISQLWFVLAPVLGGTTAAIATQSDWSNPAATPSWRIAAIGILIGYAAIAVAFAIVSSMQKRPEDPDKADDDGVVFQPHPHTRREIMKEAAFIAFPLVGLTVGSLVASGGASRWPDPIHVLGGCLLGYLIGGGVVWAVRILGSLLFGKEAMGLGDVHLMGAVGAVCGWRIAMTAFFLAAFLGVAHAVLSVGFGKLIRSRGRQMPFGPQLAAATFIVMVWREPIATYFMSLF